MQPILSIMTDIETTDTAPSSVILTTGACVFNLATGEIGDKFYVKLNRMEGVEAGLTESASTIAFWGRQSEAARAESFDPDPATVTGYREGLKQYSDWVIAMRDKYPARELCMWANDPDFDLVKLQWSMGVFSILPPWQYWEHKSCRTMELVGKQLGIDKKRDFKRVGMHHRADDDAVYQASYVSAIWQRLQL